MLLHACAFVGLDWEATYVLYMYVCMYVLVLYTTVIMYSIHYMVTKVYNV